MSTGHTSQWQLKQYLLTIGRFTVDKTICCIANRKVAVDMSYAMMTIERVTVDTSYVIITRGKIPVGLSYVVRAITN